MCRSLFPVLLCLASAQAAVNNIRFMGSTPTQAVIAYTAPDASACTMEVSESASYTPLVHDVDPALFSGANLDSRAGNISGGRARTFVIGKRAAEIASDGKYYSRALQAYTPHYYRITCGSDTATGTFTTANPALGMTYNDPYPVDPNHLGRYAWPTIDWTYPYTAGNGTLTSSGTAVTFASAESLSVNDYIVLTSGPNSGQQRRVTAVTNTKHVVLAQAFDIDQSVAVTWGRRTPEKTNTQQIIDPFTGLLVRRISSAQQDSINAYAQAITAVTPGTGWNNASTASLAAVDSNAATYTGDANQSWLFVHTSHCVGTACSSYAPDYEQMDWITVTLQGGGDGSGDDNAIDICLTADGATCLSAILTVNLNTCSPWTRVGSKCWVGTEVPVEAAWQSPTDAMGSILDTPSFHASTGGFLIRKTTTTSNTVSLDYFVANLGASSPGGQYTLGGQSCSNALAAQVYNGTTRYGYRCIFGLTGTTFWIDGTTGDSVVSAFTGPTADTGYTTPAGAAFDQTNAALLYGMNGTSIIKTTYTGQNLDTGFSPWWSNYFSGGLSHNSGATTTLSSNAITDMASFSADFAAHQAYWGHAPLAAGLIDGRYLQINFHPGANQDAIAWKGIYDVQNSQFIAGTSTLSYFPMRWCMQHDAGNGGFGLGWLRANSQNYYYDSACGDGGFRTELVQSLGLPGSGTGRDVACPALTAVSTGRGSKGGTNYCASVLVSGDMYKPSTACAWENTSRGANGFLGAIQAARPGDILVIDSEQVQLLAKDSACSDPDAACAWTVLRGVDGTTIAAHASAAAVAGICAAFTLANEDVYWDFLDDPNGADETLTYKKLLGNTHSSNIANPSGDLKEVVLAIGSGCGMDDDIAPGCYGVYSGTMSDIQTQSLVGPPAHRINFVPLWANQRGDPNYPDSHSSFWQTSDYRWALDGRPMVNGPYPSQTWTVVSGNLYKATYNLQEKVFPSEGFCYTHPAMNVSPGPITAGSSDAYKFCSGAGCYTGAGPTDVYMNCPDATTFTCASGGDGNPNTKDMCVLGISSVAHQFQQFGITPIKDRAGAYTRFLGTPFGRYRRDSGYKNIIASPDGRWGFFVAYYLDGMRTENMALKLPPWPEKDSTNRSTFIPIQVPVGSVPAGTTNAMVEFGYDSTNFYCTTHREACEAAGTAINETTPFYWASESFSGFRGAPGAITVPGISQRVLYYRLKYRDASNAVIGTGPTQVRVVP